MRECARGPLRPRPIKRSMHLDSPRGLIASPSIHARINAETWGYEGICCRVATLIKMPPSRLHPPPIKRRRRRVGELYFSTPHTLLLPFSESPIALALHRSIAKLPFFLHTTVLHHCPQPWPENASCKLSPRSLHCKFGVYIFQMLSGLLFVVEEWLTEGRV